jgi:acetoin utilization deacetylase AcuC-like enzyme
MNKRGFFKKLIILFLILFQKKLKAKDDLKKNVNIFVNNTNIMFDPIFKKHHISPGHPETPDRITYIEKGLKDHGLYEKIIGIDHKRKIKKWIETVHTTEHVNSIRKSAPLANKVAQAGVRACLTAVDKVVSKKHDNIFCATRPPGHHAMNTGKEEGFCYYNNIAIAAKYAQQKYQLKKILIIDWDYHHGNATEAMFYDDPTVLFFSTHDQFAYPGTGNPSRIGTGKGKGFNVNVHLPCGTNDELIIEKFNTILLPKVEKFNPDMVFISAGFDSRENDPLGCFNITDDGFIRLTKITMNIAKKYSDDRLVSILEGGYNVEGNAKAAISHILALEGKI